jgi:hypothetical protein
MTDSDAPETYRITHLDDIEDIEMYRPGGYHPVNLHSKVVHKLGHAVLLQSGSLEI